jgi:hypothetical protein
MNNEMDNEMGNVIPLYQIGTSGNCTNLLASVGEFYLKTRNTPLIGDQAREVLSHALAACALDNDVAQYEALMACLEGYPSADRIALHDTLDRLAASYSQVQGSECLQAQLFSIPLVITTFHPTSDLDSAASRALQASLATQALAEGDTQVVVLPWLTAAPAHVDNPVSRQHLVQVLLGEVECGGDPVSRALKLRPVESQVPVEDETVCVRYLTLAVVAHGAQNAPQAVIDSLELDGKVKPRVAAWLGEVENIVARHGGYTTVKAAPPVTMDEAEKSGLQECVRVEVARFVQRASDAPGAAPGGCALTLSPERTDGLQTSMRLCYVRGDQVLHAVRIGLPDKREDGDFDAVQFAVMSIAGQVAERLGVREVREIDL